MKYLLFFLLLASNAMGATVPMTIDMIDEVRTFEQDPATNQIRVTFWANNKVYQMDEAHPSVACLEKSYRNREQVAINFDQNDRVILGCRDIGDAGSGAVE